MSDYEILSSPGVAQADSEAVGEAVQTWLTGRGWTGPAVSYCAGYARARTRAARGTGSRLAVVLELAREEPTYLSADNQEHLNAQVNDHLTEVSAPAIAAHRVRIAQLARRAAVEMLLVQEPEVGVAPLVWVSVAAEAMTLGCSASEVAIGDPAAAAARREVAWFVTNQGGWSEADYGAWLTEGKRYRELVTRVEMMLVVEKIGEAE
ncbi:hypothetical protein [Mycolicibacter virginiensis]|uniref:hypothetical protein n=1 Tax=Mycolicibacter virginiensis TaxID=1795032 RepID=UPI001F04CF38|nr:hypothetical protein [Mycolicibacter virginiensis]ULP45888.1 hypothetical protein MJO54_13515 [Mycolicibacter virginiensis]